MPDVRSPVCNAMSQGLAQGIQAWTDLVATVHILFGPSMR